MKQENVDMLYGRLGKAVPKSKRESLKASLSDADDSKFETLSKIELTSKSPVKGISGLIGFFATLLGAVFLALNLIAFLCITPKYTAYGNYSAKLSDDLSEYYSQLVGYGKTGNGEAGEKSLVLNYTNEEYAALAESYETLYKDLQQKEEDYSTKYEAYVKEAEFVGNKTANYLNVKVQLAETEETEEEKIAELQAKIADYEEREANLNTKYDELTEAHAAYDSAAKALSEAVLEITLWQNVIAQSAEYKASLYGIYNGGTDGITAYLNKCNDELTVQLEAYNSALIAYDANSDKNQSLTNTVSADEDSIAAVVANYQEAIGDLKAYAAKASAYRAAYDKYVNDNAEALEKHTKLSGTLEGVIYVTMDGNRKTEKEEDEIVKAAKSLLEDSEIKTLLDGKTDEEIPQVVKDKLADSKTWLDEYNAAIAEYTANLNDYEAVVQMFRLSEATEETIELYQQILNDKTTWTVDYYVNYCRNNKEDEDFAAKKRAFEIVQNASSSVGNSQKIKLVSDKFDLSAAVKNKQQSENDAQTAYYSVEQLSARLQTALNVSGDLMQNLSEYYTEIKTTNRLQWLYVSDKTREKVHKDLAYDSHVQALEKAIAAVTSKDIKELLLEKFDVNEITNVTGLVTDVDFTAKIKAYTEAADNVGTFRDTAKEMVREYAFTPDLTGTLVLVFDIIVMAIFAAYFAYSICSGISSAKNENYEKIKKEIDG